MLPLATAAYVAAASTPSPCTQATGFVGTICTPSTPGRHPALIVLGGSEGGDSMAAVAQRVTARGYVCVSVAYFGAPGLPARLENIPVETVGTALDTIARRDDVDPERIAISGGSKGGELALLAASTYPRIHAVVAIVPSPFAWQGLSAPGAPFTSSWSIGGTPVPYVPYTPAFGAAVSSALQQRAPVVLRPAYDDAMKNDAAVRAAFFPLEKIDGPVLFLSAGDDQLWDSEAQAKLGLAYLHEHHHAFADSITNYPLAGHGFGASTPDHPDLVATLSNGLTFALGGTAEADVTASADCRTVISAFLERAFAERVPADRPR